MSKLTSLQKQALLKGINQIPVSNIKRKIDAGEFTIDECIENGLDASKIEEIQLLELGGIIEEPAPPYYEFCERINNGELCIWEIQDALHVGVVTENNLLENTIIDDNLLDKIKNTNPKEQAHPQQVFPHSNDVTSRRHATDIYLLGQPGAGKTSILASMFLYGERQGLFIEDLYSLEGINYKNIIVRLLKNGVFPPPVPSDLDLITITTDLRSPDGQMHPLNFIEMSGEFFTAAAKNPTVWGDGVDAHFYFTHPHKKLLFFVIDFEIHIDKAKVSTQEASFNLILSQLDKKCLKNTYCIYIIVNKSDKFPPEADVNKNAYAQAFFMDNFPSFYTNLKVKKEENGFELRSMHFSLGEFIFNNSYLTQFNNECPSNLISSISKQVSRRKGGGWFSRIFRES